MIDIRIEELGIKGMIDPFHSECVQPCSYDVHLGENLLIETEAGFTETSLAGYSVENPLFMPPGQFLLGETIEYFKIPNNVEAHFHLVSTQARKGMDAALAGLIDCGYNGRITLELKNSLQYWEIPIYKGLRIGQLSFFEYTQDARIPYKGRYYENDTVSMARNGEDIHPLQRVQNLRN